MLTFNSIVDHLNRGVYEVILCTKETFNSIVDHLKRHSAVRLPKQSYLSILQQIIGVKLKYPKNQAVYLSILQQIIVSLDYLMFCQP